MALATSTRRFGSESATWHGPSRTSTHLAPSTSATAIALGTCFPRHRVHPLHYLVPLSYPSNPPAGPGSPIFSLSATRVTIACGSVAAADVAPLVKIWSRVLAWLPHGRALSIGRSATATTSSHDCFHLFVKMNLRSRMPSACDCRVPHDLEVDLTPLSLVRPGPRLSETLVRSLKISCHT